MITENALRMLEESYLLPDETPKEAFRRVAQAYGSNPEHANRIERYINDLWFMPASPILSNAGTNRGLPISCFLNSVGDNLQSISDTWTENVWLAAKGGGIGTHWGNVRSIGERVGIVGKTSGIIPFICTQNAISLAISQGSLRRGVAAVYLPVWHPEIEEFIDIRRPVGGDPKRKAPDLHNAVVIDDAFMEAVAKGSDYNLRSPATGEVIKTVKARDIWIRLLSCRLEMGEPYLLFIDNVNRQRPEILQRLGLHIKQSNLCSEIVLPTGEDHLGKIRTAVCCLSSLNAAKFDEWSTDPQFLPDMMEYLDNVLQDFIDTAPEEFKNAVYAATRERSVGLGLMGFHTYLQQKMVPFESAMAKSLNLKIFKHIKENVDAANVNLALERGPCPDARDAGFMLRFSHCLAIAPNAASSIICNSVSPGIEPFPASFYVHKTKAGNLMVKSSAFETFLETKGLNTDEMWERVKIAGGSIQTFTEFTQWEKDVFKTAFEIDQRWIIQHAADRTPYIDQAQSTNLFLPADINKQELHDLHFSAWKMGLKSLYYCRSKSLQRPDAVSEAVNTYVKKEEETCLACEG